MNTEPRSMKIDGIKVTQTVVTMQAARDAGLFADEAFPGDWSGRAEKRPHDSLYVYRTGTTLLGYVDGEGAMFDTLAEWVDSYKRNKPTRVHPAIIDTSAYRASHMKEPRGVGSWAFARNARPAIDNVAFAPVMMTYGDAKKWARARFAGAVVIYVQP